MDQAALIGQENIDERERVRIRLEEKAEVARIQMILATYEQQAKKVAEDYDEECKQAAELAQLEKEENERIMAEQIQRQEEQRIAELKALEEERFRAEVQALREAEIMKRQLDTSVDIIPVTASYKV